MRRLGAQFGREAFDINVIDRNHTRGEKPLLHEVATLVGHACGIAQARVPAQGSPGRIPCADPGD